MINTQSSITKLQLITNTQYSITKQRFLSLVIGYSLVIDAWLLVIRYAKPLFYYYKSKGGTLKKSNNFFGKVEKRIVANFTHFMQCTKWVK